jgi:hypothetical protein
MHVSKITTSGKKLFVIVAALAMVSGWGLASTSTALADSNEVVKIKGTNYEVNHNGSGPYITVSGVKYYLQDDKVIYGGVTYTASKEGDRKEGDHHKGDHHRESDHHDHHGDHHKN